MFKCEVLKKNKEKTQLCENVQRIIEGDKELEFNYFFYSALRLSRGGVRVGDGQMLIAEVCSE